MLEMVVNGFDITKVTGNVFYFVLFLIGMDVLTGLLAGAKQRKLNSSISFDGFLKKVAELIALVFLTFIDVYFEANGIIIKIGVGLIIAYEGISVIENLGKLGVDLNFVMKYFDPKKTGGK